MSLPSRPMAGARSGRAATGLLLLLAACAPAARPLPSPAPEPAPVSGPAAAPAAPAVASRPLRAIIAPEPGAEHYVDQLLEAQRGHVVRWERPDRPIRLWVPPLPAPPGPGGADYPALVAQAMVAWNDVGLPVFFEPVPDSAGADVVVRWVRTDAEADVAGRARVRIAGGSDHITAASVALTTHAPSGYPVPAGAMLGNALHELGHVLGIQHTGRPECVMFPIPQRAALCAADRETARRWYAMPVGLVTAAAQR
jgi:predicted Zn-dependent protease